MINRALGAIAIVTDRDLCIKRASGSDPVAARGDAHARRRSDLIGTNLLHHVDAEEQESVREICSTILAGRTFSGGARSYRKVIVSAGLVGERWVLVMGPAVGRCGSVEGVIFAKFRSNDAPELLPHDIDLLQFYQCLIENAGDYVSLTDKDGIRVFMSKSVEKYSGVAMKDVLGRHFSELVHPDDVNRYGEMMAGTLASKVPFSDFAYRVTLPGGMRHIVASGTVIHAEDGDKVLMICRDITDEVELEKNLLARNRALASLNAIVVALSSSNDQDDALQFTLERILSALDVDIGCILLKNPNGRMRIRAYSSGPVDAGGHLTREIGVALAQMCTGLSESAIVRDVGSDERISPRIYRAMRRIGVEAGIAVPLTCGGPVTAVLVLAIPAPAELTLEQMEFIKLAAGILGPAIENARLHSDLGDRVHRLAMLERLAKSINAGRDVHAVLAACMKEIAELIEHDIAVVALIESTSEAEVFRFSTDGRAQPVERVHLSSPHIERLARMEGPVVSPDTNTADPFSKWGFLAFEQGSAVCVRLTYKGRSCGLLNIWSSQAGRFGEREVEILEAAAEHLAIAVSNARLYEAERVKSLQLEALAKEAQHRIKNNLQMITGLLSMSQTDADNPQKAMARCLRQIRSIATIHELLNPGNISGMLGLKECLRRIASSALLATGRSEIELTVSGGDIMLSADSATALGIIVNELVSNAVEHGLQGRDDGRIEIRIGTTGKDTVVEVIDNGAGMPPDFAISPGSDSVSGLALVTSLAMYGLDGKLRITSGEDGTHVAIDF